MADSGLRAEKKSLREARHWSAEQYQDYLKTGRTPGAGAASRPQVESARPSKFGAQKRQRDGFKFDSIVEADRWTHLTTDPDVRWVDVHPVVTLPGGVRFRADFLVWWRDGRLELEDVKGARPGTAFWRIKQLLDQCHPLTPLLVVRRRLGRWIVIRTREEWPVKQSAPCATVRAEANL